MATRLWLIVIVGVAAFIGAVGQILFKMGADRLSLVPTEVLYNPYLLAGLGMYILATAIYVFSLQYGNVSILYPIIATSYIWVAVFATGFLGEPFPANNWIGILLIVAGITVINI